VDDRDIPCGDFDGDLGGIMSEFSVRQTQRLVWVSSEEKMALTLM